MIEEKEQTPEDIEKFQKMIRNMIYSKGVINPYNFRGDIPCYFLVGKKSLGYSHFSNIYPNIFLKKPTDEEIELAKKGMEIHKEHENIMIMGVKGYGKSAFIPEVSPKPEEVSREEGQCDWCSFRATDICGLGHNIKDHCMCMGYRGLKCKDYLWYGHTKDISKIHIANLSYQKPKDNPCWCQDKTLFARLFMGIFRLYKDRQFNRMMNKSKEEKKMLKEIEKIESNIEPYLILDVESGFIPANPEEEE